MEIVNSRLARYERIREWELLAVDFSIEGGELTPKMSVKRSDVNKLYADRVAAMYAANVPAGPEGVNAVSV